MAILPKVIYRFNANTFKIPTQVFKRSQKNNTQLNSMQNKNKKQKNKQKNKQKQKPRYLKQFYTLKEVQEVSPSLISRCTTELW
jgi:type VI protein secretion system component Hcp